MRERRLDRILGDCVENHALHGDAIQGALLLQNFQEMPGNGLAFTIRVRCENEAVGALDRLGDLVHDLLRIGLDLPAHLKIIVGQNRAVLGRQVAHMAIGRDDLVVRAQILVDSFRLCGAFDDDDVH